MVDGGEGVGEDGLIAAKGVVRLPIKLARVIQESIQIKRSRRRRVIRTRAIMHQVAKARFQTKQIVNSSRENEHTLALATKAINRNQKDEKNA